MRKFNVVRTFHRCSSIQLGSEASPDRTRVGRANMNRAHAVNANLKNLLNLVKGVLEVCLQLQLQSLPLSCYVIR